MYTRINNMFKFLFLPDMSTMRNGFIQSLYEIEPEQRNQTFLILRES